MNLLLPIVKLIGILSLFVGMLFKIFHWQYANELLICTLSFLLSYCILAVINGRLTTTGGQLQVLGVAMILAHMILYNLDLRFSHPLVLWIGIAFALGGGWFFPKENKTEEELMEERYGEWLGDKPEDER